jgi:tetratricopeptide (TPR) repeat protein
MQAITKKHNGHSPAASLRVAEPPPSEAQRLLAQARNAAFAEVRQGRLGLGLGLLQDALEQEPMSHEVLSDMAALLLVAGELAHAAAFAQRALQVQPEHGASLYTLGFALAGLGETAQATTLLAGLLQDGPAHQSLQREAPDLLPLVRAELARLQQAGMPAG